MTLLSTILILLSFPLVFLSFLPDPKEEEVGPKILQFKQFVTKPVIPMTLFVMGFLLLMFT